MMGPVIRQALVGAAGTFAQGKLSTMPEFTAGTDAERVARAVWLSAGVVVGELVATKLLGGTVGEYAASTVLGAIGQIAISPLTASAGGPLTSPLVQVGLARAAGALAYAALWGGGLNAAAVKAA